MHSWSKLLLPALIALAGCAPAPGVTAAASASAAPEAAASVAPLPPVVLREAARNIQFTDTSGATHHLDEFKGKYVVLLFWAHWCGICQKDLPVVQDFGTKYKDKNTVVVPIEATGAGQELVKAFADRYGITMPLYYDTSMAAANTFLVQNFPFTYFVTPDFVAQESVLGATQNTFLEQRFTLYMGGNK